MIKIWKKIGKTLALIAIIALITLPALDIPAKNLASEGFSTYSINRKGNSTTSLEMWIASPREGWLAIDSFRGMWPIPFDFAVIIGVRGILVHAISEVGIEQVEFYIDDEFKGNGKEMEGDYYCGWWNETAFGMHEIKAVAYDTTGNSASDKVDVLAFNP